MNVLILGSGKMGSWLATVMAGSHTVALFDTDPQKRQPIAGCSVLKGSGEIADLAPELLVNCVSLQNIVSAFNQILPLIPPAAMLADVASIKGELPQFYAQAGRRFVSIHPMFGPTFADTSRLQEENVVLMKESDEEGKELFRSVFAELGLRIYEYSFADHDRMMAYSLTLPFVSSMVFSSCVSTNAVPGTTFRRHLDVANGLLSEDDTLLAEIIFNPHSLAQLETITSRLNFLWHIVKNRDSEEARKFFDRLRSNIRWQREGAGT